MTINQIAKEIHANAVAHGWWDEPRSFGEIVALCHSELSEALEEARAGGFLVWHAPDGKPEGVAVEMLDCVIRIFDYLAREGVDIEKTMLEKHEYNKGREYRHGKSFRFNPPPKTSGPDGEPGPVSQTGGGEDNNPPGECRIKNDEA